MFKILKHIERKKSIICFKITNWAVGLYIKNRTNVSFKKKV